MANIGSNLIAIVAILAFIGLFRRLAIRLGLVDHPGGRKQHERAVPLIGGIAIFFGFCFALLSLPISLQPYRGLIAGSALLLTIGIIDDFRELDSKVRLLGQISAALLLIFWGHNQVSILGDLLFLGDIYLGFWSILFTVILVVGFLNSMNMIDGQDGLAAGVALGQVALLSYLCWHAQRMTDLTVLSILGSLLAVFLLFNMRFPWQKHAVIFLGDAGSTFIAFVVAWFAIAVGQSSGAIKPVVILWILAFPVFDLLHVCGIRLIQQKPLLKPGLEHFHYLLQAAGFSVAVSTWILIVLSFALGVIGILLNHFQVPEGWQFFAWLAVFFCYLWGMKNMRRMKVEYLSC
jgi:UDP-GlcNAc:undecaprenyl-phosphate/decaprenyl-phosphate GlcNAc-1-phosphate transferase